MKRSEMLRQIEDVLKELIYMSNSSESTSKLSRMYAEILLSRVEGLGMLPPFNMWNFRMDGDNANPKSITYRKWKKED